MNKRKSKHLRPSSAIIDAGFPSVPTTHVGEEVGGAVALPVEEGPATELFFVPLISFLEDSISAFETEHNPNTIRAI